MKHQCQFEAMIVDKIIGDSPSVVFRRTMIIVQIPKVISHQHFVRDVRTTREFFSR
jgi:hypothetical protein